jgi:hypothetical protein
MKHIIAIDDTGSPGNSSESLTLKSDRYSLTAVLFPNWRIQAITENVEKLLNYWKGIHPSIKEFHFTDIINRRKAFTNLSSNEVVNIFQNFTDLIKNEELYIFHQTFTPRTLKENGLNEYLQYVHPKRKDIKYLTLDFLSVRIKKEIKELKIENNVDVFIDEGIEKAGKNVSLPYLEDEMKPNAFALSCSSSQNLFLQIADFFAFIINRNQLMMIKSNRTDFDIEILKVTQFAFTNKRLSGIEGELKCYEEINKDEYDKTIKKAFEKNGNLAFWKEVNETN